MKLATAVGHHSSEMSLILEYDVGHFCDNLEKVSDILGYLIRRATFSRRSPFGPILIVPQLAIVAHR